MGGAAVTGAAAGATEPLQRAFFELLERTCIIEAETGPSSVFPLLNLEGTPKGEITRTELFPVNPFPERWRFSKSNGVAAHTSWPLACEAARLELIERDRILRSWYGEFMPSAANEFLTPELIPASLRAHYEFQLFRFAHPLEKNPQTHVFALFGFPKDSLVREFPDLAPAIKRS